MKTILTIILALVFTCVIHAQDRCNDQDGTWPCDVEVDGTTYSLMLQDPAVCRGQAAVLAFACAIQTGVSALLPAHVQTLRGSEPAPVCTRLVWNQR